MDPHPIPVYQPSCYEILCNLKDELREKGQRLLKLVKAIASSIFQSMATPHFVAGFVVTAAPLVYYALSSSCYIGLIPAIFCGILGGTTACTWMASKKANQEFDATKKQIFQNAQQSIDQEIKKVEAMFSDLSLNESAQYIAQQKFPYMEQQFNALENNFAQLKTTKQQLLSQQDSSQVECEARLKQMNRLVVDLLNLQRRVDAYENRCTYLHIIHKATGSFPDAHEKLSDNDLFKMSIDATIERLPKTPK